ncbi:MAG: ComF family protein [Deltaproteobacteria bacterium]|nr:ComF family protein [Deltaproteobacteria bacterium]
MHITTVFRDAFEILLPRCCLVCERPLVRQSLCGGCIPQARLHSSDLTAWSQLPFRAVHSIWEYRGRERRYITAMKYKPSISLARRAGKELARALESINLPKHFDALVAIPSSRKSFRSRLFNQAEVLAQEIAKQQQLPCAPHALRHLGYAAAQASLTPRKRLSNVKQAFAANPKAVQGSRILLIDDVLTTGATVASAAHSLLAAGALSIEVAVVARSEAWQTRLALLEKDFSAPQAG